MSEERDHQLLSIKDFAALSGLKQSTLRYFDDLGLFRPAVRRASGYRYYTPQQLTTINSIKVFTDLDVPVKVVTDVASDRTPEKVLNFMIGKEIELEDQIRRLKNALDMVQVFKRTIHRGINIDENKISLEYLNEMPISIGPRNTFLNKDSTFFSPFMRFLKVADERRINLNYPVGGLFTDFETFQHNQNQPSHFFSLDPNGMETRPAGMYITAFSRGYYGRIEDIAKKLTQFAEEESLVIRGSVYIIFLFDEISELETDNYLCEISVAATPKVERTQ